MKLEGIDMKIEKTDRRENGQYFYRKRWVCSGFGACFIR